MKVKKGYSKNGEMKRCRGLLHREGVMLPVIRFIKNGNRLDPWCRQCRAAYYGRNIENVLVPYEHVVPVIDFLVDWLGSKAEISRRLGWQRSFLSEKREHMQGMKFQELMSLANEITRELGISRKVNNSEPFVVDGRQLSEIMIRWRDGFLKAQGYEEGIHEGVEYGAQKFLHDKTGMNLRTIGRVMNCELAYISESKADALLTAIDKHEMLDLGEIRRIPNPSWTPSALVEYLQESGVM